MFDCLFLQKNVFNVCMFTNCFSRRVISDCLFLRKFVFNVCMFCFVFVSRSLLWILKNFAVWWLSCRISRRLIDIYFQPDAILCGCLGSEHQLTNKLFLNDHLLMYHDWVWKTWVTKKQSWKYKLALFHPPIIYTLSKL